MTIDDVVLNVEASIGLAVLDGHTERPDLLLQRADTALPQARVRASRVHVHSASDDFDPSRLDPDRAVATLEALRASGVGVSVDDFGTGNASIEYLAALPASELKIDRSFITGMLGDARAEAIVRAGAQDCEVVTADALDSLAPGAFDSPDASLVALEVLVLSLAPEELPAVLLAEAARFWAFVTSAGSWPEASCT